MKVFISHKNDDSAVAYTVKKELERYGVLAYLDLLDDSIVTSGEKLTKHIKGKLNECSDILVVMSENTKASWWVPFEIGMASQKDMPIVNYLSTECDLPDYLEYWPRLKNRMDIGTYVIERKRMQDSQQLFEKGIHMYNAQPPISTKQFYATLKSKLR